MELKNRKHHFPHVRREQGHERVVTVGEVAPQELRGVIETRLVGQKGFNWAMVNTKTSPQRREHEEALSCGVVSAIGIGWHSSPESCLGALPSRRRSITSTMRNMSAGHISPGPWGERIPPQAPWVTSWRIAS